LNLFLNNTYEKALTRSIYILHREMILDHVHMQSDRFIGFYLVGAYIWQLFEYELENDLLS